ncbi:Variable major protein (plasmid) [Borrelia hermsii YBT]|uniref:Variable major protein n=1 Tax=Borrelia hermsii YBT TaxID=1313295 RepID=W5T280_BORHE|nr:Variable major protein [Borrelia hermsii YBT]
MLILQGLKAVINNAGAVLTKLIDSVAKLSWGN